MSLISLQGQTPISSIKDCLLVRLSTNKNSKDHPIYNSKNQLKILTMIMNKINKIPVIRKNKTLRMT